MTTARKRTAKDGPFCWQNKAARRHIREAFDETHNVTTALSVYDALTEIASDAGTETFTTTHAWIQRISGVSVRTIQTHLKIFSDIGLVRVFTPKLRAPSTYILLRFGNGSLTTGNDCAAFGNGPIQPSLPTSEERLKNSEENQNKPAADGVVGAIASPSEAKAFVDLQAESIYKAYPRKVARKAALKAIRTALRSKPAADLLEKTKAFADAMSRRYGSDKQFIPYPATWFNEGRFEDDPAEWEPTAPPSQPQARPEAAVKRINISAA